MFDKIQEKKLSKYAYETNVLLVGGSYTQNFDKAVDVYESINVVKFDLNVFDYLSG